MTLGEFPGAAGTNPPSLARTAEIWPPTVLEARSPKSRRGPAALPSPDPPGGSFLPLPESAAPGALGLQMHLPGLRLHLLTALSPVRLCLFLQIHPTTLDQGPPGSSWLLLNWVMSAKTLFPQKPGFRMSACVSGRCRSTHNTHQAVVERRLHALLCARRPYPKEAGPREGGCDHTGSREQLWEAGRDEDGEATSEHGHV